MPFSVQCKKCLHYRNEWCEKKLDSPDPDLLRDCLYYSTATRADRIRAMTDEELAEWLGRIQYDTAYYCAGEYEQMYPYPDGWLDWLKQEAQK